MANRDQDNRSGRSRGGYRGWDDNYEEGDSSARAGSYDEGRGRYGRDTHEQSGSTGRYAGYGDWGQGDYNRSGPGRGGDSGQERYGQSGYGGGRDQGYGQGNYGQPTSGNAGTGYAGYGYGQRDYGRDANRDRGSDWGQRDWNERASNETYGGYRAGSGQSSGYGGPSGDSQFRGGSSEFGYGGAQGGGSQYGNYGTESVFGGSSQFGDSQYGYGATGRGQHRGKGPKGYQRSDERTKELISERLRDDPHVDASDITVTVSGGKVTLDGTVDSRQAKNAAEDIVEQCGCDDVQNNLRVQRAQESSSLTGTSKPGADRDRGETARQRH